MPNTPDFQDAKVVYALYACGFFVPVLAFAGLLYAYYVDQKSIELNSHLDYQISTFWYGLLILVIGTITTPILIGYPILFFWMVWTIIRVFSGFMLAQDGKAVDRVEMLWTVAKSR